MRKNSFARPEFLSHGMGTLATQATDDSNGSSRASDKTSE